MTGLILLFILCVILTFSYFTKPKKVKPLAIYTYINGQKLLHNDNGPAYIDSMGTEEWYQNGELHREDGPARIDNDGSEFWFKNDLKHRIVGPAIIRFNHDYCGFDFEWYQNGKLHRLDGPAVELAGGDREWWYKGNQINCHSQEEFNRLIKLRLFW